MWCDNCLLIFPLRAGALAWAVLIALYSIAGGLFLIMRGQYFFFFYPEWYIYGGIGILVGVSAVISMFSLSNRSYIDTVVFIWPFVIIISAIRAIFMIVELNRGKDNIVWECDNGGQVWSAEAVANSTTSATGSIPSVFCSTGFSNLNAAFIGALIVDIVCQIYMYFLSWRYMKRLEHYSAMPGPYPGGFYKP